MGKDKLRREVIEMKWEEYLNTITTPEILYRELERKVAPKQAIINHVWKMSKAELEAEL